MIGQNWKRDALLLQDYLLSSKPILRLRYKWKHQLDEKKFPLLSTIYPDL